MLSFLLIIFSSCTFGKYDCIHEVYRFETFHECREAQQNYNASWSSCAMISETPNQDPIIHSLGKTKGTGHE